MPTIPLRSWFRSSAGTTSAGPTATTATNTKRRFWPPSTAGTVKRSAGAPLRRIRCWRFLVTGLRWRSHFTTQISSGPSIEVASLSPSTVLGIELPCHKQDIASSSSPSVVANPAAPTRPSRSRGRARRHCGPVDLPWDPMVRCISRQTTMKTSGRSAGRRAEHSLDLGETGFDLDRPIGPGGRWLKLLVILEQQAGVLENVSRKNRDHPLTDSNDASPAELTQARQTRRAGGLAAHPRGVDCRLRLQQICVVDC